MWDEDKEVVRWAAPLEVPRGSPSDILEPPYVGVRRAHPFFQLLLALQRVFHNTAAPGWLSQEVIAQISLINLRPPGSVV